MVWKCIWVHLSDSKGIWNIQTPVSMTYSNFKKHEFSLHCLRSILTWSDWLLTLGNVFKTWNGTYGPVKYIIVCSSKQLTKQFGCWSMHSVAHHQTCHYSLLLRFYPIQMSFKPCNTVLQPIERPQYDTFQPQCQETHAY